jgi:hypothetical protein
MAYTIDFSVDITLDRTTGTLTDETVYGGGNPTRDTVRVYVSGYKMNKDSTIAETLTVTSNTLDPQNSSIYTFNIPRDGWFKFPTAIVKIPYSALVEFDKYDAVYDAPTGLVYRSLIDTNLGNPLSLSTAWEAIASPGDLANNKGQINESLNIESIVYQRILTPNSEYSYGNLISCESESCCGDCDEAVAVQQYEIAALLLDGAIEADYRSYLPQGEGIVRRLDIIFENCGC